MKLRRLRRHSSGTRRLRVLAALAGTATLVLAVGAPSAPANHSWGGYHWARTQNPFWLSLGDNVGSSWDAYLSAISADWSRDQADSSWPDGTPPPASEFRINPLNTRVVAGGTTGRKCRPSPSRIEVCDASYGRNGWLGLASIWISGLHITQGTVKLNDTYFGSGFYNTSAWRQSVACQEVGHTFGLDHQDESGADLDTCMDYSTSPNIHPDQHDYNELATIYSHTDSSNGGSVSLTSSPAVAGNGLKRLKEGLYVEDLGGGRKHFVWVFWKNQKSNHYGAPADAG
jgi:hypothetical protein